MTPSAPRQQRRPEPLAAERVLQTLGVDAAFAEAVLGDLAEEYAARIPDGVGAARCRYAGQALRSAPYLLASTARHPAGRARLATILAGLGTIASVALLIRLAGVGPPERLVAGIRDTLVVNHLRPMPVPTQVLDAAGRPLADTGVRYAWVAGAPLSVSPRGVVTCKRRGDATVRASLGPLAADVVVRCRPVREVRAPGWTDFVLGDPPRDLAVEAIGVDGRPVTLLGAWLKVEDTTVAKLDGLRVYPRSAGESMVEMQVGDRTAGTIIRVFEPVRTIEGLRPEQRLVAAPVRLGGGASLRWRLPTGRFYLTFLPGPVAEGTPTLSVDGAVMCIPALGPGVFDTRCLVREPGAWLTIASPGAPGDNAAAAEVVGTLELHRDRAP